MTELWNLGSVQDEIFNIIPNDIPATMSGATLNRVIDGRRLFAEAYINATIGSVDIAVKYQSPLVELSIAKVLRSKSVQGGNATDFKIGEFTIKKGKGSAGDTAASAYEENALQDLSYLKGGRFGSFKAWGV